MGRHDFAARSCCDLDLQGNDPNVARYLSSQYSDHFCEKNCNIQLQITKLWAGHNFAARSCCDLDLQGSDPYVARDTSSQYGDNFCEIVSKSTSNNKVMGRTRFCYIVAL